MQTVVISGSGLYTPPESVSNQELAASFNAYVHQYNTAHQAEITAGTLGPLKESSAEFIEKASGIKNRYVLHKTGVLDPHILCPRLKERPNTEPSIQAEWCIAAAEQALHHAQKKPSDIGAVIVACSAFQREYPAIAIEVQALLGIQGGFAFDMNVACSSATFAIQLAQNTIQCGQAEAVLVISPEIASGHLNYKDRDSHFIFGDACTAVVLETSHTAIAPHCYQILGTKLLTQFSNNIRANFGFLNRTSPETADAPDKLFVQEGRKVFKEVTPLAAKLILEHLSELGIKPTDLKRLWLHQANLAMNTLISKKILGREGTEQEVPIVLHRFANTASAGSIIAFHLYHQDLNPGDIGLLCSFGAGYSVGNVVLSKLNPAMC